MMKLSSNGQAAVVLVSVLVIALGNACDGTEQELPPSSSTPIGQSTAKSTVTPESTAAVGLVPSQTAPPAHISTPVASRATTTPSHKTAVVPTPVNTAVPAPVSTPTLPSMVQDVIPGVVQIVTPSGTGSGFIIDADGLVVTNAHVVQGYGTVDVRLSGGETYEGEVLGVDEVADLALLDIRAFRDFEPVALGDSDSVAVGEDVIAMGFPLGGVTIMLDSPTITRGIVSAKRVSDSGIKLLQTDAAINPGSSGGPLIDREGRVVGVNTSKAFESGDGRPVEGIGLAVAINEVRDWLDILARGDTDGPESVPEATADSVAPASDGSFVSVSAGGGHSCGVKTDGGIACWGSNEDSKGVFLGQSTPPDGTFSYVSAGILHTCGVRTDGTAVCWGANEDLTGNYLGQSNPPDGAFLSVSAAFAHTCGLKLDGTVSCWGSNRLGMSTPSPGRFLSVDAGLLHSCGLKTDSAVACWGDDSEGQSTPPQGTFVSVSVGFLHSCGIQTEGTVTCWGSNRDQDGNLRNQSRPVNGTFASISAGAYHTCGVKMDGTGACWGWDEHGQSTPPSEDLRSVSAGWFHSCGVKIDGTVACWGDDSEGQSSPLGGTLVRAQDKAALVALYNATDGASWARNDNWLSEAPLGQWYGVTTDQSGHVIGLGLDFNNLRGKIPEELGNLVSLTHLGLVGNRLTGEIPSELGRLSNLEVLGLSANPLSGAIPPELGNLANLTKLYLVTNQLSGTIPRELGNLTNLVEMFLSSTRVDGAIPSELGNLTNLEVLSLHSNQLSGEIPPALGSLGSLRTLSLEGNQFVGVVPLELGNLTDLRRLNLQGNRLTGDILPELNGLSRLEELLLGGGNQWSGCIPEGLMDVADNDLDTLELPICRLFIDFVQGGEFYLHVPETWARDYSLCYLDCYSFKDPDGDGTVFINVETVEDDSLVDRPPLAEYAEYYFANRHASLPQELLIKRETLVTTQGFPAIRIEAWTDDRETGWIRHTILADYTRAFSIIYTFPADIFESSKEFAYYSFDTFRAYW